MQKTTKNAPEKKALTYSITAEREDEIREYVEAVHAKTKLPKGHIVSELLIEGIRRAKNFYPAN